MSRAVFLLVLIAVVAICTHEASAQRGRTTTVRPGRPGTCTGPNEVMKRCACPLTCSRPRPSKACAGTCRPGCGCIDGYVRTTEGGRCIRRMDCYRRGTSQG